MRWISLGFVRLCIVVIFYSFGMISFACMIKQGNIIVSPTWIFNFVFEYFDDVQNRPSI